LRIVSVRIQQGRGAFLGWILRYGFGAITGRFAVGAICVGSSLLSRSVVRQSLVAQGLEPYLQQVTT